MKKAIVLLLASCAASPTIDYDAKNTETLCQTACATQATEGPQGPQGLPGATGTNGAVGITGRDGEGFVQGSRLRTMYWVGEDGSKTFASLKDTKYDSKCAVQEASQSAPGVFRCVPLSFSGAVFKDDQCKHKAAIATAPKTFSEIGVFYAREGSGSTLTTIYRTGSPDCSSGTCVYPCNGYAEPGTYYDVAIVPVSDFVIMGLE